MKQVLLILVTASCVLGLTAQDLPRGFSAAERQLIANGFLSTPKTVPGAITYRSPVDPPRSMAEWEEMQGIVITWTQYRSILAEIVRHAAQEGKVFIVNQNEASVRNYLSDRDIDPDHNIEYIEAEYNSVWVRDYGANPAYVSDVDSLVLVDWIYNRPRPKDDQVPGAVAGHLGVPLLSTTEAPFDLVNTGGNYMADGNGRAFSSNLVLDENGPQNIWGISNHSETEVDAIMQQFLGINEYVKMTVLPYDAIHHIDMHMKLVDEQTLVIGEYPQGVADGPQIEANLQYVLESFKTATGKDYRVVRIPMPPDQFDRYPDQNGFYRTYANSIIINSTILVPTYEERYDTTALRIWQETMPGYKIVGIDCNDIIPASGALHCITKEVGAAEPLLIRHWQPFTTMAGELTEITARLQHTTGISDASVFYRPAGDTTYLEEPMTSNGDNLWTTYLPGFDGPGIVEYYISGTANNGKQITRPIPAPEGFFRITVEESTTATTTPEPVVAQINVFPNPARELTCLSLDLSQPVPARIALYDMHGRLVETIHTGPIPAGQSKYFFDADRLTPGIYTLSFLTAYSRHSVKVVVVHRA